MAKVTAFKSIDMLDFSIQLGEVVFFQNDLVVIEGNGGTTFYFGNFTFPDGKWEGTIRGFQDYDALDRLFLDVRGLSLDTSFAIVGADTERGMKLALRQDDRIAGSAESDRLAGFGGDDVILGRGGDDRLLGGDGRDRLDGGSGNDAIKGGRLKDVIDGGRGNDLLRGDHGFDVFVFSSRDGRDVISDFTNRQDRIQIDAGAERFSDIEVAVSGDDLVLSFARTEILLRDVDIDQLGRADFIFV